MTKQSVKRYAETITASDLLITLLIHHLNFSEIINITDNLNKGIKLNKSETITIVETFSKIVSFIRNYSENITIQDIQSKEFKKALSEYLSISDLLDLELIYLYIFDAFLLIND